MAQFRSWVSSSASRLAVMFTFVVAWVMANTQLIAIHLVFLTFVGDKVIEVLILDL